MFVKATFVLVGTLFLGKSTSAQFNDTIHYYVNYASTGIINKTNEGSSYVLANSFRFNINKKSIRLNGSNNWIYGKQQRRLSNNDFTSTVDFNLYKTFPNFYYWGLANYDKSYSLKIIDRFQAGLGGAYNVVETPNLAVNVSDGILYESSNLQINDSTSKAFQMFRNSFRLRYRVTFADLIILDGTHFLQNSLSEKNDYIVRSISNVTFKIRKWLGLTTSATYNRTQRINRENLFINFGLTAEKYF